MRRLMLKTLAALTLGACTSLPAWAQQAPVDLEMYYPVAVGGPITKIIDGMVSDFEKTHPNIHIKAVYSGSYQDSVAKALTAVKGGTPPQLAVLLSTDMYTLIDQDAIVPIDDVAHSANDKEWLGSFYDAFMQNSRANGHVWGAPFQRSTIVMYYNKDMFKAAGLNPDQAPANWTELVADAKKLTVRDAQGQVTRWGLEIPSGGAFAYWLFQALTTPAGAILMNQNGTETYFTKAAVVKSLQFWQDLSMKDGVMPKGTIDWGTTPTDFLQGKTAIMWTTTGNLTNVLANAKFPFGVAMMPKDVRGGSPTGGGNFYIFKKSTPAQREAALTFIQWATSPEQTANWSIATGYVATSPAAWQTDKMKAYVAKVPQAVVARDQLPVSVAEFSTHDNQRVTKILNDAIQSVLTGAQSPTQAMTQAQGQADRILRSYR